MIYSFGPSTPANTLVHVPQVVSYKMTPGLIYRIEVYFPPGPSGLLGVALSVAGVQIAPYNRTEWFTGDDVLYQFDDLYEFSPSTDQIDIFTYNLDTVYPHLCRVNIGIVSDLQFINAKAPVTTLTDVVNALGALTVAVQANTAARVNPITAAQQRKAGT